VGPVPLDHLARHGAGPDPPPGHFGVLVPGLEPCKAGVPDVDALVKTMWSRKGIDQSVTIPAGFTYLGQFIDHDITFDPTSFGERARRPRRTANRRTPRLDLDSLYGGGPALQPYLYEKDTPRLLLGKGTPLDLPRNHEDVALLGDRRNDENAIISQLHLLFARFHNRIADDLGSFEKARKRVLRHYHWIVLHEYLPTVLGDAWTGPRKHFEPKGGPFIPAEFSGAAFRFGHSMVRGFYDYNRNFGRKNGGPGVVAPFATLHR